MENEPSKDQSLTPSENTPEAIEPTPVVVSEKKHKKPLLLVIVMLLVLIGALLTYFFVFADKKEDAKSTSGPVSAEKINETGAKFYVTESSNTQLAIYDPVTGTKKMQELPLDEDRFIRGSGVGANQDIQVRQQGKQIFYKSMLPKADEVLGGEGEPELQSAILSLLEDNKETKLLEVDVASDDDIADWVVTPDGATIYYLQTTAKQDTDLHMLSVADKKDVVVKAGVSNPGTINNPLLVTADGELFFISLTDEPYHFTEHKVANGEYSVRDLGEVCQCSPQYPQAFSPDATKLLFGEQTSGTVPSDFNYYMLDTATDKQTKLAGPLRDESWRAVYWSPDAQQLVYDTTDFAGAGASAYMPRIELMNIADKKAETVVEAGDSEEMLAALGWSPRGGYIAYAQGNKIKFYSMDDGKTLEKTLSQPDDMLTLQAFGWF